MLKLALLPTLCLALWAAPSWAQSTPAETAPPAAVADAPAPEQILVVGQKPGPGMWKISKGDHVLWVFGTYAPLPKKMEWRSQQVEAVIGRSQEYLAPPGATASPGFFKGLTLLPSLIGIRKNPDGAQLRDLMPPEEYARWTELKTKYMPNNRDAERERPIFAAQALARAARKQAGLDNDEAVRNRIQELIKKNKLKTTNSVVDLPMDNAGAMLKNFKKTPLNDVACLSKTMATLETDIAEASARANAWARGNLDEMRKLDFVEREQACFSSVFDSAVFDNEPAFRNMRSLMRQKWLAAAENALATNTSTFALMTIKDILDPNGVIPALAAKGYRVEEPD
ncbi:TraB/GumN family protein [Massilia sp. IC2-476]|uniref:TraB/GumN family protein n=1 Tax=Massilia sp. IC2-476 TaxID=2887199 RepID=UPI001D0FF123|nr:TraB/GumN family protein [Massilia sp. IC2-476]MCC2973425.1 TraB/GumN family protein [Massilia sp. IC2-476]